MHLLFFLNSLLHKYIFKVILPIFIEIKFVSRKSFLINSLSSETSETGMSNPQYTDNKDTQSAYKLLL